jgi:hypothetical protein
MLLNKATKEENERLKAEIQRLRKRLDEVVENTTEVLKQQKEKTAKISRIATYSIFDADFLNKLSEISELQEIRFLFDAVHREIYEAALIAPSDDMILNAIGKGKGVRVFERKFSNPKSLFTEEVIEQAENEPEV